MENQDDLAWMVFEGKINIEDLTDEQQEMLMITYNQLALHWIESPKEGLQDLAKQILLMIEAYNLQDEDSNGKTIH
jgi:hypothetical protein